MIAENKKVKIMPSYDLTKMRLSGIAGRTGVILEQVFGTSCNPIGYMVLLDKTFQGEQVWFIPEDALKDEEDSH